LAALVRIEYLWPAMKSYGPFQIGYAEFYIQGRRQNPGKYLSAVSVHDYTQIHERAQNRNAGYVSTQDLIGPCDMKIP